MSKKYTDILEMIGGDNAASGGYSVPACEHDKIAQRALEVVSNLDELQQFVLNRRFGLSGERNGTCEEVAVHLTKALSPQLRTEMAKSAGVSYDIFNISIQTVVEIEARALRNLYKKTAS